jgi:hypothetical protein
MNFLTAIWSKYPRETQRAIDISFYNDDLMKLILLCTLDPTRLGFDVHNDEINRKLPEQVETMESMLS